MAAGLARLEVQERVERDRRDSTACVPMPDDLLRQILAETTNTAVKLLTGYSMQSIFEARERLGVPNTWTGRSSRFMMAAGRLAQKRWVAWQDSPPSPLSRDELEQLIQAEADANRGAPSASEEPPLALGDVLEQIRQFREEQHRWPTCPELAAIMKRKLDLVNRRVNSLMLNGFVERDGHTICITPHAESPSATKTETWTPEQVKAHLAAIIPKPQRVLAGGQMPVAPDPQPNPEVNTEVVTAPTVSWPPSDKALLAEEQEIKSAGGWVIPALVIRYVVTSQEATAALKAAHDRAKQAEPRPIVSTPEPVAKPVPAPAPELTVAKPRGRKSNKLPGDAEFVAEAEAIRARGESVFNVLGEKYGVKGGQLWTLLGDARERQGLPRKMGGVAKMPPKEELWPLFAAGVPVAELAKRFNVDKSAVYYHRSAWGKAGSPGTARPTAPAAPLTEYLCAECADTGFQVGGHSHEFCACPEGQLRRQQAQATSAETSQPVSTPAESALVAAEAVQEPSEPIPPAAETEPSTGPTELQRANLFEVQQTIINTQQATIADLQEALANWQAVRVREQHEHQAEIDDLEGRLSKAHEARIFLEHQQIPKNPEPILMLWNGDRMRQVEAPAGPLLKVGDHYAEPLDVGGHQRYAIWQCVAEGMINGDYPLRILHLVLDTTAVGKEAA